jgi:hypothetical protein
MLYGELHEGFHPQINTITLDKKTLCKWDMRAADIAPAPGNALPTLTISSEEPPSVRRNRTETTSLLT